MIVRSDKDDKDDGKDDKDHDMDKNSDGKDDVDSKDGVDSKDDGRDNKDSVDDKDADDKDDNDDANDKDDNDDDDDFRDDNDDLLSFELDEIEEKDSDGNEVDDKHSVDSFSDVDFQFSRLNSNFKLQGVSTINVNLSTYLDDPKANLDIMVYLFRESGKITFGNETFAVQAGTVKFNIKVRNKSLVLKFYHELSFLVVTRLSILYACSIHRKGEHIMLKFEKETENAEIKL